ncbi:MAG: putative virulence factor [Muribaculaceae bacterium]|nr:putative virulence factor [Muribaculaceae bacterium]
MTIKEDINIINEGLKWLKDNKPEQYEQSFFQMIDGRRRLLRQLNALTENPAIGAFGESQTGKSYQINTLLNRTDKAFKVKSTSHPEGVGFVDAINPIGDDREATGVVTRLTSFKRSPQRYNPNYPVIVKLLRPGQIVSILASGYYANIRDYTTYSDEELRQISERIYKTYSVRPDNTACYLTEDDILDVKSYLGTYMSAPTQGMRRSKYFETLTKVIRRVPVGEWVSVLKYLWHENEAISRLFERLVNDLERLQFAREVYVPIETVMHGGENRRTIMSVACLNGLDEKGWPITSPVFVPAKGNPSELTEVPAVPTCDLCAVSAEVIFKIDDEYLDESLNYDFDQLRESEPGHLPAASRRKLADHVDKSLLADTDLLDFPGARSPEQQDEANCREGERDKSGQSVLVKLFLRGKIAYLFNHYSESHMMKVLMFCHHNKQSEVKNLHILLDQWVRRNVGSTVAERAATLARTGGISPLMLVATKINIDMTYKDIASFNTETAVNNRWEDRFRTVLLDAVLNWTNADWFKNWSGQGQSFKDTYLLRSFAYCACTGQGNGMFEGYNVATSSPERELKMNHDYYRLLRRTFVSNGSVRELFFDPELAWDVASTLNNDGSLYIIERMGKVARAASEIRSEQMKRERDSIMQNVKGILEAEYDSDNESEKLLQNIDTVANLRWELDASCTEDNYYFGHLLQALQVTEVECLSVVHKLINDPNMGIDLNDFKEYQIIRRRCRDFAGCANMDDKWNLLMRTYGWRTREQAVQNLEKRGINTDLLFAETLRPKTPQVFIADHIMDLWRDKVRSEELMNTFTGEDNFSPVLMKDLVKTLVDSAERLHLADYLAEQIRSEVSIANIAMVKESLVADMMASIINGFVNDFGYSMLSAAQKDKARQIVADNDLSVYNYIEKERKSTYTHDELSDLFASMVADAGNLTDSFDNRYNEWIEYMTIAYIVHLKRSELRPEVNQALGDLLQKISFN